MTEEKFHFEMTTDDVSGPVEFPDQEIQNGQEILKTLFRACGIQPGTATVTLGSEQKKTNE